MVPGYRYITHRVGHGIGMGGREWTYLVKGNRTVLRPGMCFSDEPGIYVPGELGVRHEDIIFITESGPENMTKWSGSPEDPAAVSGLGTAGGAAHRAVAEYAGRLLRRMSGRPTVARRFTPRRSRLSR